MRFERIVLVGLLSVATWACADGGGRSPTAPAPPPVQNQVPGMALFAVSAVSGSLVGKFDEASTAFSGEMRIRFRALLDTRSWEFEMLRGVTLTKSEAGEWLGSLDVPKVQPIEVCAASQLVGGSSHSIWMNLVPSDTAVSVTLSDGWHLWYLFTGPLNGRDLSATLARPGGIRYFTWCAPI